MIFSIGNQKGGVAKTTTTHSLGFGLRNFGYKVLLIDLDPQGNLTSIIGCEKKEFSVLNILLNEVILEKAVIQVEENIDILISDPLLYNVESKINMAGKEYRLREALVANKYDYVLIDTPPAMNLLTINAMVATDRLLIPLLADTLSLEGLNYFYENVSSIKKYYNQDLEILGVFFANFKERTNISKKITEFTTQVINDLNIPLLKTKIRECTAMKEAQLMRKDIYTYAKTSNASTDYLSLVNEILESLK
ncbi:hypothetical protein AB834_01315 [PVC group bacterium (ex Bugula neritina AB1)]|nr:hypothetical protein AB834_01315 [PVC group bacterium (ex Bugula neritina AB1)]